MKIVLIADGRSPTTRRWIQAAGALGHEIILVSTYPCGPVPGADADVVLAVAFSAYGGSASGGSTGKVSGARKIVSHLRPVLLAARYLLGPLTLQYYGPRLRKLVEQAKPDLVHALRIPYEGMLAAELPPGIPLAVSIWGNDLTLHARGSQRMAELTRKTLRRADALVTDSERDVRLARAWGFGQEKPVLVVPGSGGLNLTEIARVCAGQEAATEPIAGITIPAPPLVVNPRGFRTGSVRTDTFFSSIPLILERRPGVGFACAAMAGQQEALNWVDRLNLHGKVTLLPHLSQQDLWRLFSRADISLSISQHDGTPNSLLEAMAVGAFPIAGDIESLREWITPGVNGLLVQPDNPQDLADAVLLALDSPELRQRAAAYNAVSITQRAEIGTVRDKIQDFYTRLAVD
jgi:glycosyltransferase involved in cell wall biosynthesis